MLAWQAPCRPPSALRQDLSLLLSCGDRPSSSLCTHGGAHQLPWPARSILTQATTRGCASSHARVPRYMQKVAVVLILVTSAEG